MAAGNSTLAGVAKAAGVSTATVNRVLKGGYVSDKARRAVEAALRETGYRPNVVAQALKTKRSFTIGEMLTAITVNPFFVNVAHCVEETAMVEGYRTFIFNNGGDAGLERIGVERFIAHRVDAVLFCTAVAATNLERLEEVGIPYVQIERARVARTSFVRVNNYVGAREAMRHLAGLGHRRIAFVGGDPALHQADAGRGRSVEDDRLQAYLDGLGEAGLPVDQSLIRLGRYYEISDGGSGVEGYRHTRVLLDLPARPTAIFATCDVLAAGVLQAIYDARLRVPADISVVGFDDTLAFNLAPALTTVAQPMQDLGRIGFDMALAAINGEPANHEVVLPSRLVVRASTAPAA
jgi:LacI family transcriptional regulator